MHKNPIIECVANFSEGRDPGEAAEIAEMVCWLCSDHASYVSGANFNVDGGYAIM